MERKDKLTIERWELEEIIDSFRILVNAYPKIKERKSCLDRKLIDPVFRREIDSKVAKTNKTRKTGGHRPSVLYKYNGN